MKFSFPGIMLYIVSICIFNYNMALHSIDKDVLLAVNVCLGLFIAPLFFSGKIFNNEEP